MKYKLLFFFFFSILLLNAQANFNHIIITDRGEKIDCRIKKFDIAKPCGEFVLFKTEKSSRLYSLKTGEIKEIIVRKKRYIIAEVDIDNATNDLNKLRTEARTKDFTFEKQSLFLEILAEGKATLYRSNLYGIEKFFFLKIGDEVPKQLLYKKYFLQRGAFYIGSDYAAENNFYYRQLYQYVPCFSGETGNVKYPAFTKSGLVKYFKKYNAGDCK